MGIAYARQVTAVVERYIDAVRRNDAASLPLHADVVCEFPLNTYRGAAAFTKGLDVFSRVVKRIDVLRLVIDGEHCVRCWTSTRYSVPFRSPSISTS